jgi:hypothetical protein
MDRASSKSDPLRFRPWNDKGLSWFVCPPLKALAPEAFTDSASSKSGPYPHGAGPGDHGHLATADLHAWRERNVVGVALTSRLAKERPIWSRTTSSTPAKPSNQEKSFTSPSATTMHPSMIDEAGL